MSRKALARQVRGWSMGAPHASIADRATTNWTPRKDPARDGKVSRTDKLDEATIGLFGNDPVGPWVHPIKDASHSGKQSSDRKTLWEEALYTQQPNLMNDQTHINAERVPSAVGGPYPMEEGKQDPFPNSRFVGMYTEDYSENPGDYWKYRNSQTLYSHMLFEQSKAAEAERYGGEFTLPTDDYQTQNGVLPLLSAEKFRNLKYKIHEPIVRKLNDLTNGGGISLEDIMRNKLDEELLATATNHSAWCTYWNSIYPRGGTLRPEFKKVLEDDFGCVEEFQTRMISAATKLSASGGGVAWVVYNRSSGKVEIQLLSGHAHPYNDNNKIIAAMIVSTDTIDGYDSAAEYAQRFLSVFDYNFAYSAYCSATGQPKPSPLVF